MIAEIPLFSADRVTYGNSGVPLQSIRIASIQAGEATTESNTSVVNLGAKTSVSSTSLTPPRRLARPSRRVERCLHGLGAACRLPKRCNRLRPPVGQLRRAAHY